jgi:hypothetical protein
VATAVDEVPERFQTVCSGEPQSDTNNGQGGCGESI